MSARRDTLSQKDVDSLLRGQGLEELQPQTAEAVPHDFRQARRIPKERLTAVQNVYERFAVGFQGLLTSRLRVAIDVTLAGVEQVTFGEFVLSLPNPCAAFIFDLGGDRSGQGVMDFGNDFAFLLVDRLFGGPGEAATLKRALTPLERMVVKGVAERAIGLLGDCWRDHVSMEPAQAGFEATPDALQIVNRDDSVLVASLETRCGAFTGLLATCLPIPAIESFLTEVPTRTVRARDGDGDESRDAVESIVRGSRVPVVVRFPDFSLPLRAVRNLEPGQTIDIGHPVGAPLDVRVAGRIRFAGLPGRARGAHGCQISAVLGPVASSARTILPTGQVLP